MCRKQQFLVLLTLVVISCGRDSPTGDASKASGAAEASVYSGPLLPARKGDRYGYISDKGVFLIEPRFVSVGEFGDNGLAPVEFEQEVGTQGIGDSKNRDRLGYIDRKGAIVIKPQFADAEPFKNGLAVACVNSGAKFDSKKDAHRPDEYENRRCALIDATGKFLFPPKYQFITDRRNDLGHFSGQLPSTESEFFDSKGVVLRPSRGEHFISNGVEYYISRYSKKLNFGQFDHIIDQIRDTDARRRINATAINPKAEVYLYSVFSLAGNNIMKNYYARHGHYCDEKESGRSGGALAMYKAKNIEVHNIFKEPVGSSAGLIDLEENVLVDFTHSMVICIGDGLLKVGVGATDESKLSDMKWGVIRISDGKYMLNPTLDDSAIGYFSEGLLAVKDGEKLGFVDASGFFVIKQEIRVPRDSSAASINFKHGFAKLPDGSYIDRLGKPIYQADPFPKEGKGNKSSGTAFWVSRNGQAITNHHVVDGCGHLKVSGSETSVKVQATDQVNDLALLQTDQKPETVMAIAKTPEATRQGDEIVVFGFPLNSVLSSGGNLTPGVVSAVTGLGNNTNQIQITAAIQPGSSGSPVLNRKGEIIGVVAMKLDDRGLVRATGQVGQSVNFAVSGTTLRSFLSVNNVDYKTKGLFSGDKSLPDIADDARKATLIVECAR